MSRQFDPVTGGASELESRLRGYLLAWGAEDAACRMFGPDAPGSPLPWPPPQVTKPVGHAAIWRCPPPTDAPSWRARRALQDCLEACSRATAVSLSHSGELAIAVAARADRFRAIGLDIEPANRCISERLEARLRGLCRAEELDGLDIWVVLEASVKALEGRKVLMSEFEIHAGDGELGVWHGPSGAALRAAVCRFPGVRAGLAAGVSDAAARP